MQPLPCGCVAFDAKDSLHPKGTGTVFLTGNVPDRTEPLTERLSGILKDGPRSYRNLVMTPRAFQEDLTDRPSLRAPASGAEETLRPTQFYQIVSTGLLGCEELLELIQIVWELVHTARE